MMCERAVPTENVTEDIKQMHFLFWGENANDKKKGVILKVCSIISRKFYISIEETITCKC